MALYVKQRDLPTQNLDFRKQALSFLFISTPPLPTEWTCIDVLPWASHCIGFRLRWAKHGACPPRVFGQVEKKGTHQSVRGQCGEGYGKVKFRASRIQRMVNLVKMCSLMCSPGQVNLYYYKSSDPGSEIQKVFILILIWLPNMIHLPPSCWSHKACWGTGFNLTVS